MKKFFVFSLSLLLTHAFSQNQKLRLGIQLFPNMSTAVSADESVGDVYYNSSECFVFSYSAGIQADWQMNEKWTFSSGVLFNKTGDRSKKLPPDLSRGFLWSYHRYQTSVLAIEVPLLFQRNLGQHFFIQFGISPRLAFKSKLMLEWQDGSLELEDLDFDAHPFGLYTNLGIGFQTLVAGNRLQLAPYFQYNALESVGALDYMWIDPLPGRTHLAAGLKVTLHCGP